MPCNDCSREDNCPPCPHTGTAESAGDEPSGSHSEREAAMTATSQLMDALRGGGYTERQALNLVFDVMHEEAERIRSMPTPRQLQHGEPTAMWEKGRNDAAASLDPDDDNWQGRCTHCYQPWNRDHVCYIGWYDWTRNQKKQLVDAFAYAIAMVDGRTWKTRTPNEDDPLWTKYTTYGLSCWEQMLDNVKGAVHRQLKTLEEPESEPESEPQNEPEELFAKLADEEIDDTDLTEAAIDKMMQSGTPVIVETRARHLVSRSPQNGDRTVCCGESATGLGQEWTTDRRKTDCKKLKPVGEDLLSRVNPDGRGWHHDTHNGSYKPCCLSEDLGNGKAVIQYHGTKRQVVNQEDLHKTVLT